MDSIIWQMSGSHFLYKTLWSDELRANIQTRKGYAKAYQVAQINKAIERLEAEHGAKK